MASNLFPFLFSPPSLPPPFRSPNRPINKSMSSRARRHKSYALPRLRPLSKGWWGAWQNFIAVASGAKFARNFSDAEMSKEKSQVNPSPSSPFPALPWIVTLLLHVQSRLQSFPQSGEAGARGATREGGRFNCVLQNLRVFKLCVKIDVAY